MAMTSLTWYATSATASLPSTVTTGRPVPVFGWPISPANGTDASTFVSACVPSLGTSSPGVILRGRVFCPPMSVSKRRAGRRRFFQTVNTAAVTSPATSGSAVADSQPCALSGVFARPRESERSVRSQTGSGRGAAGRGSCLRTVVSPLGRAVLVCESARALGGNERRCYQERLNLSGTKTFKKELQSSRLVEKWRGINLLQILVPCVGYRSGLLSHGPA